MERFAVDFAENRGGTNAELATGAQNAHGNFTAIGNQDFPEHESFAMQRDFSTRGIAAKP